MSTWLNSTAVAAALYALAGATTWVVGTAERQRGVASDPMIWPPFWLATGGLLLVMAVGRATNVGDLVADIGREGARSGGWYDVRRAVQAWVIGAMAVGWATTVAVAVWRVPGRRSRYLPTVIAVSTLVCFAAIRLISLHQVDALLHDREFSGVRIGSIVEVGLLLVVVAVSTWRFPRSGDQPSDCSVDAHVADDPAPPLRG